MKDLLMVVVVALATFIAYALLSPTVFAPQAWTPPHHSKATTATPTDRRTLTRAERLAQGTARGPEDVAVDEQGRIYAGYADGTIRRFDADGNDGEVFATTNGRPLGLAFARSKLFARDRSNTAHNVTENADGGNASAPGNDAQAAPADALQGKPMSQTLIVADADKGLLAIDDTGAITVLTTRAGHAAFAFTNDVDVADDGTIYFSDASSKYGQHNYRADMLEHGGHGRLLKYNPKTKQTKVLLAGLQFANGVAVGPDERYVLVNETGSYRVIRYWLTGTRAGQHEIFIDNLAGFPDGISFNGRDTFWLAVFAPRNEALDFMAPYPWLRRILFFLPEAIQPRPARVGHVLGLDTGGQVVIDLEDQRADAFAPITSVEQVGDTLYLGSLSAYAFASLPVPQAANGTP